MGMRTRMTLIFCKGFSAGSELKLWTQTSETKTTSRPPATLPLHEQLMRQHLQEENLPQAVMPACPINKVLKGQKALVTGANSGIGQAVAAGARPGGRGCGGQLRHASRSRRRDGEGNRRAMA